MKMTAAKTKRNEHWFFIVAFVLSIMVFALGLLLGNYIAMSKLKEFRETEEKFLIDLIAFDVRESILKEDVCKLNIYDLFKEKVALGRMLTRLEERLGKENRDVMAKKEIYELIQIKTLRYLEKIKTECHQDYNIVLFFYTNKKNDPKGSAEGCEDQGKILDQLVYEHNEKNKGKKIYVFSFDVNSQNLATKALMLKYNVTRVPALIINGESYGYLTKTELESLL